MHFNGRNRYIMNKNYPPFNPIKDSMSEKNLPWRLQQADKTRGSSVRQHSET